ncbi:MAG: hypothetical protein RL033_5544 [Pseudomonadota bacterium]
MKNRTSLVTHDGRASRALGRALRAVGLAALVVLPVVLGCYGDVEILEDPLAPGPPPQGPTTDPLPLTPIAVCEKGDAQCSGSYLQSCVTLTDGETKAWLPIQNCLTPELCAESPARCLVAACRFGEMRCQGVVPERCSEDLTEREQLGTCASAGHCSLDAEKCAVEGQSTPCCLEKPCDAGELRCNDGQLERCRDSLAFDPVVTCATQKLCELSLDACGSNPGSCACQPPVCEADATRCTGATLEHCNADQTGWELIKECPTEELCQLGSQREVPVCEPESCAAGAFRCSGALLERCNAGQSGFDPVRTCEGGAAFCDSVGGGCADVPCQIGETRCNGAQVERCRADRMGFDAEGQPCATPQLCQVNAQGANCIPPTCDANEFVCDDNQPLRCNAGRTAFANAGQACLRAELCSDFRQRCDFCFPSRRECTPDLRFSRTCAPDGNSFGPLTFCPLGCIAATGACQACAVGDYSCQGGALARCNDGFSFTPLNRGTDCSAQNQVSCNGSQVVRAPCEAGCNLQRNVCNQCSGQQRSCADTNNFVSCQLNGTFGAPSACGAGLLCTGAGQCACVPGQLSCSDDSLVTCNPTGTALVAAARCGGPGGSVLRSCSDGDLSTSNCGTAALCSASTGDTCSACLDGERSCAAGQPQVCSNGQQAPAPACGAGFSCEGAGVCRCSAGEVRCSAGALQQCAADRGSFEPAATCDGATLRSCNGNTLVTDSCGSADLCLSSNAGACAQCLESEPIGCSEDGSAEVRCVGGQLQETACDGLGLCLSTLGCVL